MPITKLNETIGSLLTNFWQVVVVPDFFSSSGTPLDTPGRTKECGPFEASLRPQRATRLGAPRLIDFGPLKPPSPESDCNFKENTSDHPQSIVRRPWYGIERESQRLATIPNGAPYVDLAHYLMLPAAFEDASGIRYPHEPQALDQNWIANLLAVAAALGESWAVGWNTLRAGATVNHRHAHLLQCSLLPCEKVLRLTVGSYQYAFGWPAGNLVLEHADTDRLWRLVDRLQGDGVPFNLLIRSRTVYVFGRQVGRELVAEFPAVMAVMELSGRALVSDASVFDALNADLLAYAMRKTTVPTEDLFNMVR